MLPGRRTVAAHCCLRDGLNAEVNVSIVRSIKSKLLLFWLRGQRLRGKQCKQKGSRERKCPGQQRGGSSHLENIFTDLMGCLCCAMSLHGSKRVQAKAESEPTGATKLQGWIYSIPSINNHLS
ncbi:hypothetical protein AMECASPLE_033695 [Ameca splendens]|uniref:Uncharacterized protein n=1 Tax=Ameca splendens TaxID=208324 RepID=A0ABV0YIE7_9TELE